MRKFTWYYTNIINIIGVLIGLMITYKMAAQEMPGIFTSILATITIILLGTVCFGLYPILILAGLYLSKYLFSIVLPLIVITSYLDGVLISINGFAGELGGWVLIISYFLFGIFNWMVLIRYNNEWHVK